jgi:hypothetical protein
VVKQSYIHDTQGNGIWCDEECNDTSLGTRMQGGVASLCVMPRTRRYKTTNLVP